MAETKQANIKELIPDSKNFNRHSEYGMSLLEKSVGKFGMGRSILLDKNNKIIAGNGITETAGQLGIEDVEIIESDGKKLIAVKRTDIDLDTPEGREMALADNATNKANLTWDFETIEAVCPELEIEPSEWGVKEWEEQGEEEATTRPDTGKIGSLADRFVVPPFSVLDSRKGKWKERKALWREKIGDKGETRENTLSGGGIEPQKPCCTASYNGGV